MTDEQGKPPGTLTPDEVKNELRQFKNKLFNMPAAVAGMAREVVGKPAAPGQPVPPPAAAPPPTAALESAATIATPPMIPAEELLARLTSIEARLAVLEQLMAEVHASITSQEDQSE